jgi:hypothetical protein
MPPELLSDVLSDKMLDDSPTNKLLDVLLDVPLQKVRQTLELSANQLNLLIGTT